MMKKLLLSLILLFVFCAPQARADHNVLYLYNWYDYIPDSVIKQFTKETGIEVLYSTYESNEDMFETLSLTGGNGYDVVVPSGYFVSMMVQRGLLRKIDKSRLANYENLDEKRLGANPDYCIPYFWGSTLLLVNSKIIAPENITSWNDLFKPELAGNIFIIDDLRDVFSIALYSLGYSINTQNRDEIRDAYEWLKKLLPLVKNFSSEKIEDTVVNESFAVALMYNGEALGVQKKRPEYIPVYPKEGVPLWLDCLAIPKGAKNVENAYKFIDFILRPDINKVITEEVLYSTPNKAAFELLDAEITDNKIIYPTDNEIGRSEFLGSVEKALPIYERYWKMLKNE